jgi:hypothetical protein
VTGSKFCEPFFFEGGKGGGPGGQKRFAVIFLIQLCHSLACSRNKTEEINMAFIEKMKMTQEENFPNVAKQPRPLDRREKPQVRSDKKVTAHARCGQRGDGRLVPLLLVGILPQLIVSFGGIRARKSKWRADEAL